MVVEGYEMLIFYEGIRRYMACRWSRGVEGGVTFKYGRDQDSRGRVVCPSWLHGRHVTGAYFSIIHVKLLSYFWNRAIV